MVERDGRNGDGKSAGVYDCVPEEYDWEGGTIDPGAGTATDWPGDPAAAGTVSGLVCGTGVILLGGCLGWGLGFGGGAGVARKAGISIRRPKKLTRYNPNKKPMMIRKSAKIR